MAEMSSSDHGRNRFLCVLFFPTSCLPFSKCCPTSTDISRRCKGRSWLHQTAGMDSAFYMVVMMNGLQFSPITHTDSTIRIPRGSHHTESQNSIPAQCTFHFQHALPP